MFCRMVPHRTTLSYNNDSVLPYKQVASLVVQVPCLAVEHQYLTTWSYIAHLLFTAITLSARPSP
jgi:hypothetical protein